MTRRLFALLILWAACAPALAQTTVFNYISGKRTPIDDLAHEHFGRTYRVVDVDDSARIVFPKGPRSIPPKPVFLRGRCLSGIVTVLFIINAEGAVIAPHVAKTDNAILSQHALARLKEERFLGTRVDGKPAALVAVTDIHFRCEGTKA